MAAKVKAGISPHPEIMQIQQKFSIPAACFVFALIGLALGLTVARDSKLAGFVVGVAVIFGYYIVMFLAEAYAKGTTGTAAAGLPLRRGPRGPVGAERAFGLFGAAALVWRARFSERQFPSTPIWRTAAPAQWTRGTPAVSEPRGAARRRRSRPCCAPAMRFRAGAPGPLRETALSAVVGTLLPRLSWAVLHLASSTPPTSFQGCGDERHGAALLIYKTPQFVYFVIDRGALLSVLVTFGTLSRTSESTVINACVLSLTASLPVVHSLAVLERRALCARPGDLARANRRDRSDRPPPFAQRPPGRSAAQQALGHRPRRQHYH